MNACRVHEKFACLLFRNKSAYTYKIHIYTKSDRRQVLVKDGVDLRAHKAEEMLEGDPTQSEDYNTKLF